MPAQTRINLPFAKTAYAAPRKSARNGLLIWLDAWREYSVLQKLDADALADMGLTETARASVTVSQIAARMRG